MDLPTFNRDLQPVSLDDFGRDVARRRASAGGVDLPRNSGQRRTPSKQNLLAAMAATGANW